MKNVKHWLRKHRGDRKVYYFQPFLVDFIHSEKYDDLTRKCKNSFATILIEDMKKTFFSRVMRTNNLPWEKLVRTKQTGCEALP